MFRHSILAIFRSLINKNTSRGIPFKMHKLIQKWEVLGSGRGVVEVVTPLSLYTAFFGSCYRLFGRVNLHGCGFSYELWVYRMSWSSLWQIPLWILRLKYLLWNYFFVWRSSVSERAFLGLKFPRPLLACPSDKSSIKINMEHLWTAQNVS